MTQSELESLTEVDKYTALFYEDDDVFWIADVFGNEWTIGWHGEKRVKKKLWPYNYTLTASSNPFRHNEKLSERRPGDSLQRLVGSSGATGDK